MERGFIAYVGVLLSTATLVQASELAVGARSVQKLVAEQLFDRHGRWYLLDNGPCYIFLESPRTRLSNGRLVLDAHLSARIGVAVGADCIGSGYASNVTLSGKLIGKGSTLTVDDIRIDHVEDGATAQVIDLMEGAAPQALSRAFSLDVLAAVRGSPMVAAGIPISLNQFRIADVTTRSDSVVVHFDLSLSTP
jgi:hypothetical protein